MDRALAEQTIQLGALDGGHLDAEADATIEAVPAVEDLALVLGAEGTGVRRLVQEHCDLAARLPTAPTMASLNVSVACGIALYALARRGASSVT